MHKYLVEYSTAGTVIRLAGIEAEHYRVVAHSERMPGMVTFFIGDDPIHAIAADRVISIEKQDVTGSVDSG